MALKSLVVAVALSATAGTAFAAGSGPANHSEGWFTNPFANLFQQRSELVAAPQNRGNAHAIQLTNHGNRPNDTGGGGGPGVNCGGPTLTHGAPCRVK